MGFSDYVLVVAVFFGLVVPVAVRSGVLSVPDAWKSGLFLPAVLSLGYLTFYSVERWLV